jgi:hypothetical protein
MAITCRFNSIASFWQSLILQPILDKQKNNIYILWMTKNLHQEFQKCILELMNTQQDAYGKKHLGCLECKVQNVPKKKV